jgi:hypothetical protein
LELPSVISIVEDRPTFSAKSKVWAVLTDRSQRRACLSYCMDLDCIDPG